MASVRIGSEFTYTSGTGAQQYRFTILSDQTGNVSVRNVQTPFGLILDSLTSIPASVSQDICDAITQVEAILAATTAINGSLAFIAEASKSVVFSTPMTSTTYRVQVTTDSFVALRIVSKTITGFTVEANATFTGLVGYDVFI